MLLLIINIMLFFLGDVVNQIARFFDYNFLRFTGVSKAIGLIINFVFIARFNLFEKAYVKPLMYCIITLIAVFVLSNLFLKDIDILENLKSNALFVLYACFLPFLLIPFFSMDKETTEKGLRVLLIIFWANAIFIIIGFLFDIQVFQTYFYGERFGYKGLFERSTYVSYIFVFIFIYYYYNWQIYKDKKWLIYLLMAFLISIFVGTKRIYLCLMLLSIFHFFYGKPYTKKWFYIFVISLILLIIVLKKNIFEFLTNRFGIFIDIYQNEGFITTFTSYRSNLLIDYAHLFIHNHWSFLNYIFGGGFFSLMQPEMDLIDAYLFFGIFGPLIYLFIYRNYLFNYKIKSPIVWFYVLLIIILALFSSGIIFSADFAIPIIIFSSYFYFEHHKVDQFEKKHSQ
jgi:hypothetical protein